MQWNLLRLRKERGLEQKDMAKLLEISTTSYAMKERGESQFKADEMFLLGNYFKLSLEQIFLPRNFGNNEINK